MLVPAKMYRLALDMTVEKDGNPYTAKKGTQLRPLPGNKVRIDLQWNNPRDEDSLNLEVLEVKEADERVEVVPVRVFAVEKEGSVWFVDADGLFGSAFCTYVRVG